MGTRIPDGRPVSSSQKAESSRTDKSAAGGAAGEKNRNVSRETGAQNLKKPAGNVQAASAGKNSGTAAGIQPKAVFVNRDKLSVEPNIPLSNIFNPNSPVETIMETSGKETVSALELFKQIAAALGLPQDTLSVTLVAFLRFFSFSPDPALMRALRREILSSLKSSSPGTVKEKAALEAKVLALVSAFDKGVGLSQEALENYAGSLTPMAFAARDDDEECSREELPNAEELRNIAEEQSSKDSFFDLLNSLPGKSGNYWKIFPFKINIRGTELKVFLRLLKRELFYPGESEYVIADIGGPKRQWHCFMGKIGGKLRAEIQVYPGLSAKALKFLEREAKLFLGKGAAGKAVDNAGSVMGNFSGFEEIRVRNGEEIPSWMEDLCDERLPSINEEV